MAKKIFGVVILFVSLFNVSLNSAKKRIMLLQTQGEGCGEKQVPLLDEISRTEQTPLETKRTIRQHKEAAQRALFPHKQILGKLFALTLPQKAKEKTD